MHIKLKWIFTCLAFLCFIGTGMAQQTTQTSIQYNVAYPAAGLQDYIGESSFRGLEFTYHYLLTPQVGLGFSAGMNIFYEKERNTFSEGTYSITGTQYRYANLFPALVSFSYFFTPEQTLNPYVNLGVGALYVLHESEIGLYTNKTNSWQMNLKPEIGVIYALNPGLGLKLSGKFYQTFESDELAPQSYAALGIGIVFKGDGR